MPCPTARTSPCRGFSLAVSGMMMPPAVFSSAAAGFTSTRSANGLMFILVDAFISFCKCAFSLPFRFGVSRGAGQWGGARLLISRVLSCLRQLALLLSEKRAKSECVAKIIFLSRLPARPWQSPGRCLSESCDLRDLTDGNKPPRAKIPAFIVSHARVYTFLKS